MIDHPARPVRTWQQGQALGADALNILFPSGSRWHYGGDDEVYEICAPGAYRGGVTGDTTFLKARGLTGRNSGKETGLPPHTLIPRDAILRERGLTEDPLDETTREALHDLAALEGKYNRACEERDRLTAKLDTIRKALA